MAFIFLIMAARLYDPSVVNYSCCCDLSFLNESFEGSCPHWQSFLINHDIAVALGPPCQRGVREEIVMTTAAHWGCGVKATPDWRLNKTALKPVPMCYTGRERVWNKYTVSEEGEVCCPSQWEMTYTEYPQSDNGHHEDRSLEVNGKNVWTLDRV